MKPRSFGEVASGDAFQLDGKLYRKRSKYSARLLRLASGHQPPMKITRLIHPDSEVASSTSDFVQQTIKSGA